MDSRPIVGNYVFLSKYSQTSGGQKETWDQAVNRVMDMHMKQYRNVVSPKDMPEFLDMFRKAYTLYHDQRILGAQRALQYGGELMTEKHARFYNCLSGETSFITNQGVFKLNDFKDGDEVTVLTHKGRWRKAIVRNYGKDWLNKIVFYKGSNRSVVYATSDHRWLNKEGKFVNKLKVGDKLFKTPNVFSFSFETASFEEKLYWCYGFVYGDGVVSNNHSHVRLCDQKRRFKERFEECGFKTSTNLSLDGDFFAYTGTYLKTLPLLEKDGVNLVRAFVSGYLSADGHLDRNKYENFPEEVMYHGIQTSSVESSNFIEKVFPCTGAFILNISDKCGEITNYKTREFCKDYTLSMKTGKTSKMFKVSEIEEKSIYDDVWCLEVEEDKSFILSNGIVTGNCSSTYVDRVSVFEEAMYLLLCGCGVGYSVQHCHVNKLPVPMGFNHSLPNSQFTVPDTIEGWAEAIGLLMTAYYEGRPDIDFDYSMIRPRGAFIRGGFSAPGPEPLKEAIEKIHSIVEKIKGRKLRPFELHYIICVLANSVVTGGVRRSAMISIFDADDVEMASCKTGAWITTMPELCRSNNSAAILPDTSKEIFDKIYEFTKKYGEPGFVFIDSTNFVYNPCFTGETLVAVADGRNAVSIKELAENVKEFPVYSGKWVDKAGRNSKRWKPEIKKAIAFKTGDKEVVEVTLSDGTKFKCTPNHKLALTDGTYLEACKCVGKELQPFFTIKEKYRTICSRSNGYARQYRMIWEYFNGSVPEGFDIDHIENGKGDFIENLHLLERGKHQEKSASERLGENNPMFRRKDVKAYSHNMSISTTLEKNGRYKGLTNKELYEIAKKVHENGGYISCENCNKLDSRFPKNLSKNRFGGKIENLRNLVLSGQPYIEAVDERGYIKPEKELIEISVRVESVVACGVEPVYDLTVEDNHNFYIITKGDENYENCTGVLVHNCGEVGMYPRIQDENGEWYSGWGFCNLAEINGGKIHTPEELYEAAEAAAVICTLQAGYTRFKVLERWSQKIAERDALIGVGITGLCENPEVLFDPEVQRRAARIVVETNKKVAKMIGINPAARCTVIKPSGNSSQLLGTLSGITPGHSRHYIRHIQASDTEQAIQEWMKVNPDMVEDSVWAPDREKVIAFPVTLPEGALLKQNLSAIDFLKFVLLTKRNWIEYGTNFDHPSTKENPKLRMNVSNTCTVRPEEWDDVREFLWEHRSEFGGISLLSSFGDLDYPQAPYTEVLDETELAKRYGAGAILSSGLVVDAADVFKDVWEACNAAMGNAPNLLQLTDKEISHFITSNIKNGRFLVDIDGICFSDVNCVIDHLKRKVERRQDWVRRFNSFADKYMFGDRQQTAYCLKHVNAYHKWQHICRMRKVNYDNIVWRSPVKEAGSDIGTACMGGKCEWTPPSINK